MHAIGGRLDVAGREQLIDKSLGGVAGVRFKVFFRRVTGDGVGVVGEEVSEVEGVGSWTVYANFTREISVGEGRGGEATSFPRIELTVGW